MKMTFYLWARLPLKDEDTYSLSLDTSADRHTLLDVVNVLYHVYVSCF